ncbi:hypothetical protein J6590_042841 [Homalodisca vitripennis]|nr:hypothetical protein J6590_042841 [Homalodisca vitripennis]
MHGCCHLIHATLRDEQVSAVRGARLAVCLHRRYCLMTTRRYTRSAIVSPWCKSTVLAAGGYSADTASPAEINVACVSCIWCPQAFRDNMYLKRASFYFEVFRSSVLTKTRIKSPREDQSPILSVLNILDRWAPKRERSG